MQFPPKTYVFCMRFKKFTALGYCKYVAIFIIIMTPECLIKRSPAFGRSGFLQVLGKFVYQSEADVNNQQAS